MSARKFDVIVIGAGPAGEVAAGRLAKRGGKRVALVERELIGGECSYYACMPSKALLRPEEALAEARRIPGAAEAASGELDVAAVLARRDEVIHNRDDATQMPWIERHGIELVRGEAALAGERRVRVGDEQLVASEAVVLAVGSGAAVPPIPGLAEAHAWSNREATTATSVPASLLVLGGGVVGVELAQAWASLGSRVTLVEAMDRLIADEEPYAGEQLRHALEERGVTVITSAKAAEVERSEEGITLALEGGETLSGDHLLVAVGRKPHTEKLGLESVGLEPGKSIEVDEYLRAPNLPWLYAVGDVNGRSLLTHSGKYQARIAADNILGEQSALLQGSQPPPRVIFTDPQIAAVGETLAAAHEAGLPAEAIDIETSGNAGASFYGRGTDGTTRFVVDTEREVLLGVTFVGAGIAEFVQAATVAVTAEVPLRTLAHVVAPFPTRSELWLYFLEAYEERRGISLHTIA